MLHLIGFLACLQCVLKACGGPSARDHVTVIIEDCVHQWMGHVTASLDGWDQDVKTVSGSV